MPHDAPWEHYHDVGDRISGYDDTVVWTTVGFDVGSSTAQAVFSRITLTRHDAQYVVSDRSVLHESEIILTPYASPQRIDRERLAAFIDRQYDAAGLSRAEVDTGAVILTGLALQTANARAVADAIADDSGRFVAVSAGDALEARLAASGAGAPALSADLQDVLVHIDIGGGTTKMSAWRGGKRLGVAAIDVGARLVLTDGDGRIVRLEPPARQTAEDLPLDLREGEILTPVAAERLTGAWARNLLRYAGVLPESPRGQSLLRTAPMFPDRDAPLVEAVVVTGGVSEYVYGRENRTFGDLGQRLGQAVRAEIDRSGVRLIPFQRGIRATVLGVSQHSVQLSGNTIYVSDEGVLPLRNAPILVAQLGLEAEALDPAALRRSLEATLSLHEGARWPALALRWRGSASYARLKAVADAVAASLTARLNAGDPMLVAVEGDVAGVLGAALEEATAGSHPVVCLDGVHLHEFDHVDVGSFAPRTRAVPVVVKSLLFAGPATRTRAHVRHHA